MRVLSLLLVVLACGAHAFILPTARPAAVVRASAIADRPTVGMTSLDKKAKAATRKVKSSRAVTKRFKATSTGKLLRRKPFRQHILTKKHPLRKQKLRGCPAATSISFKCLGRVGWGCGGWSAQVVMTVVGQGVQGERVSQR